VSLVTGRHDTAGSTDKTVIVGDKAGYRVRRRRMNSRGGGIGIIGVIVIVVVILWIVGVIKV
jgi:hypothetical protein